MHDKQLRTRNASGSGNGGGVKSQITFGLDTMKGEEWVFLTQNATTVKAHIGSTAVLPCEVKKDSQFGMVSSTN